MSFLCPLCGHSITLKDAKPGKYKPKCPKCSGRFALTVASDPNTAPAAEKLPVDEAAATMQATMAPTPAPTPPPEPAPTPAKKSAIPAMDATMAPSAQATLAPSAQATLPPTDPNATGAWEAAPTRASPPASEALFSPSDMTLLIRAPEGLKPY